MPAIDVDPQVLALGAAASAHAAEQALIHIEAETKARNPELLVALVNTLTDEGPYAYTLLSQVRPDGSVVTPILTSREEIEDIYGVIRGMTDLHEVVGLTEIRGSWYLFQDSHTIGGPSGSDVRNDRQVLGIFPSGSGAGITGELVWLRTPRSLLGAPDEVDVTASDPLLARRQVYDQYERYLGALRANDFDGVLAVIHDGASSAVRDYVAETGTLLELVGKDAHRAWFRAFLDKYEVIDVQRLSQVTEDWYVFAELRFTVQPRSGGSPMAFHTAEFHIPSKDGRFIARIGHGTEPA